MSFVPGRRDFSAVRLRASLPYFLILWLGTGLFLVLLAHSMKQQLQDDEFQAVEKRLDNYLGGTFVSDLIDAARRKGDAGALQGLTFVRLVKNGEQMLLTESNTEQLDFHQLAGLDPKVSGVWISLTRPDKHGSWTIVAKRLSADIAIQVGVEDSRLNILYERIVKFFRLVSLLWGIPALGMSLACVRRSVSSICKVRADIEDILADGRTEILLSEVHTDDDVVSLYRQLNQLLQHNRRLISEMQSSLDNVAHDLRTPMTRLRAVAEYGLQEDASPERLRDALSDCLEESERVLSMLKIMMTVAEAESGTMNLQREWVDLEASLMDVVSLYEYVAEEKKIEIRIDLQTGVKIFADRTRIAQVWANLLDNSLKYGKEGGNVVISSGNEGNDTVINFTDNGIGISKNEIHRIWERLYRGDRSRTQPGLGLGLNYVRAVVEAHGGMVAVESELQRGTRLTIRLRSTHYEPATESMKLRSQISGA